MSVVELTEVCSTEPKNFSLEALKNVLSKCKSVDQADKGGMTALMYCAYHGHTDGCSLLLNRGAKVNAQQPTDGYTPLMFATIAGRTDTVKLLLDSGANTELLNKIGKTAVQLGAFVGQHDCVQVINNYFSLSSLQQYSMRLKANGQPRLTPDLTMRLHEMLATTNIHPVKVVLEIEEYPDLLKHSVDVCRVLESVCKESLDREKEALSLKAHLLGFILTQCVREGITAILKRLLTLSESGRAVEMDRVLRQCLREFPHIHSVLLQQFVKTLAKIEPGGPPSALSLFTSAIVGEKTEGQDELKASCDTCGLVSSALKKCSKCKQVYYCGLSCQKLAWSTGNHKKLCKKWAGLS